MSENNNIISNQVVCGFDYSKFYPVWDGAKRKVDTIKKLGDRHYVVELKNGWCYKENSSHRYIVENFNLYSSIDDIVPCSCLECIISGNFNNKAFPNDDIFLDKKNRG